MSILVTRPLPQGEALVSRLRAMGRVAWSFPLIEFTPGRELPALGDALARLGPTICYLRYPSMRWNSPMPVCSSRACPGPLLRAIFAIGRTTALALHTVSGQHIHYPLDREISEVLLQLPELQNIAGKCADPTRQWRAGTLRRNAGPSAAPGSHFVNVINVVQNITMAQKKRCAGNLAESPRWWSPAARCCSSYGR
ncbi:uroporphyrinogen-III synthase [Klebsiella pneumoniae]|uniref:Uroporphyrinogen-III synthase n=1 Tax=Klebsiella pneumoniae TaxID=573 RepID=A0A2X3FQF4_KLEPN|nr:uroporphyrinogen-III synthase [Klebsiella pneumoniae]